MGNEDLVVDLIERRVSIEREFKLFEAKFKQKPMMLCFVFEMLAKALCGLPEDYEVSLFFGGDTEAGQEDLYILYDKHVLGARAFYVLVVTQALESEYGNIPLDSTRYNKMFDFAIKLVRKMKRFDKTWIEALEQ